MYIRMRRLTPDFVHHIFFSSFCLTILSVRSSASKSQINAKQRSQTASNLRTHHLGVGGGGSAIKEAALKERELERQERELERRRRKKERRLDELEVRFTSYVLHFAFCFPRTCREPNNAKPNVIFRRSSATSGSNVVCGR